MKTCIVTLVLLLSTNLFAAIEFSEDSTVDAQAEVAMDSSASVASESAESAVVGLPTMPVSAIPPMMQSQPPVGAPMMPRNRQPRSKSNMGLGGMGMGMLGVTGGRSFSGDDRPDDDVDQQADQGDDLLMDFDSNDDVAQVEGDPTPNGEADGGSGPGSAAVPEPAAIAVWSLLGLLGLTLVRRRS